MGDPWPTCRRVHADSTRWGIVIVACYEVVAGERKLGEVALAGVQGPRWLAWPSGATEAVDYGYEDRSLAIARVVTSRDNIAGASSREIP